MIVESLAEMCFEFAIRGGYALFGRRERGELIEIANQQHLNARARALYPATLREEGICGAVLVMVTFQDGRATKAKALPRFLAHPRASPCEYGVTDEIAHWTRNGELRQVAVEVARSAVLASDEIGTSGAFPVVIPFVP